MKKLSIVAIILMVAMLFVACSPNSTAKEPFAPDWANGDYTGSITAMGASMPTNLSIDENGFTIDVSGFLQIETADANIISNNVKELDETNTTWKVSMDGIVTNGVTAENKIDVEITPDEKNLSVSVTIEDFVVPGIEMPLHIDFSLVETPSV